MTKCHYRMFYAFLMLTPVLLWLMVFVPFRVIFGRWWP
jgi:hypothetical protein